ncbi:MAG: ABC transporter permease [Saprospiraceae bacterium]
MFDYDKWQEIFESIKRHKLRTALTAFGVFWGIFMLVLLLGAGQGLSNGIKFQFSDEAINSIWLNPGRTSIPYNGIKEGKLIKLDNSDFNYIQEQYENVDQITGRLFLSGDKTVRYNNTTLSFTLQCIHPAYKTVENIIITKGRFLNDNDLEDVKKVCVIGRIVKTKLFGNEDPIGKEILIDNIIYLVVGEFYDTGGEWMMKNILIPITTAQKVYAGTNRLHRIVFTTEGLTTEGMAALQSRVLSDFSKRKNFDPKDRRAFRAFNNSEDFEELQSMIAAINGIIWLVGIFSIIAGVIGVSNIMLIIVKDRTKEIGIRKAMGATPLSIVSMIIQESILITALAGYLGLACGVGLIALAKDVATEFWRNPEVHLGVAVIATLVLIIAGALAGLLPALQAARINPVLAMKSD